MQHNANFHSVYNKVSTAYLWSYKVDHFYVANAVQRPKSTEGMNTKGMVTDTMRKNFLCWVQDSFTEQAFDRSKKQVIISITNIIIIVPSNAFLFLILQLHVIIHKGRHILISCWVRIWIIMALNLLYSVTWLRTESPTILYLPWHENDKFWWTQWGGGGGGAHLEVLQSQSEKGKKDCFPRLDQCTPDSKSLNATSKKMGNVTIRA